MPFTLLPAGGEAGALIAPAGTRMAFHNAAAPFGWAIDATLTDHTIQINQGAGGTSGGANGYSTMFSAQWTSDGHALTVAELAAHNHGVTDPTHTHTDSGHVHAQNTQTVLNIASSAAVTGGSFNIGTGNLNTQTSFANLNAASTGISTNNNGSGTAHTHTKTFNAQFIAMVVAQKS